MSARVRSGLLGLSLLVALYVIIGGLLGQTAGEGAYRQLGVFSEVLAHIKSDYVEEPNITSVTRGALYGLLEALDPYSSYLSAREFEAYQRRNTAHTADVGLVLSKRFGMISVVAALPGSPGEHAGLRVGDLLESIAGFSTREMSVEQAKLLLAGAPGSIVKVAVVRRRAREPTELELVRAVGKGAPVTSRRLESGIGYVRVVTFSAGSAAAVRSHLERLQQRGVGRLVLDLRGCATGEAREAVTTAQLLLQKGLIAYLEGQQFSRQQFTADPRDTVWRGPLVLLMDGSTAGPAELVAAAVSEQRRGELVGAKSYGVGSVQKVIPLDDGSALILTVAKYYTASGKAIQGTGIKPTIAVEPPVELEAEEEFVPPVRPALENDPVVLKALEVLRAKVVSFAVRPAA
ncbi:MAG: S41 family peptidase [Terriglobia bacterium]